ncbi:PDZ domain-containing protein [Egibacter rhizosphaerae]|uniref:PDZ domain-containing protein n=1 Tax=Egibacter rhizosphaerae TaxID=1670831 RepID=A0A411YJF4_9ACTN|nr:trypsin-like peptidase domain-containing protein [Egibacter rhizosphaerae]QBI21216.1 PDZ domain-containing protein [Egibacter rhizosphaerae]
MRGAARRTPADEVYPAIPAVSRRRSRAATVTGVVAASCVGALVGGGLVLAVAATAGDTIGLGGETPAPVPQTTVEPPPGEGDDADSDRIADVAEAVLPAVVRVDIDGEEADQQPDRGPDDPSGNGSGVIYGGEGHIITNNHVVEPADDLTVVFADGSREEAEVVGTDRLNDLAVIQVDRDDLTVIGIGDQSALRVGQPAVAVGSPFGLEGSVTSGVISALDRGIDVRGPGGAPLTLPQVIQTDAPINPGNSGGPLVDRHGQLIGINSAILTSGQPANAGVGFAIPVDTVVDVADELIAEGRVTHPFIGIEGATLSVSEAEELGIDGGAEISEIVPDTPAAEAGLQSGDVVVGLGDDTILAMEELVTSVLEYEVGEAVEVHLLRDGEEETVEVVLAERPGDDELGSTDPELEGPEDLPDDEFED